MKLKFEFFLLEPNLALNRPTQQSSVAYNGISIRAVDGNPDGTYNHGYCTHTENSLRAWWRVDLGVAKEVKRVAIYNRQDCCT